MSGPFHFDLSTVREERFADALVRAPSEARATGVIFRPDQASSHASVPLAGLALNCDLRQPPLAADLLALLQPFAAPSLLLLITLTSSDAHDKASTPRAMPAAALCVAPIAEVARTLGLNVTLCPRYSTWLQQAEDAVRLAMRVNKRHVGVALDCDAWQQTDGRVEHLPDVLRLVLPKLNAVIVEAPQGLTAWQSNPALKEITPRLRAQGWSGPTVLRFPSLPGRG